jgi:hypothetical protein
MCPDHIFIVFYPFRRSNEFAPTVGFFVTTQPSKVILAVSLSMFISPKFAICTE